MNNKRYRWQAICSLVFLSQISHAQSGSGSSYMIYALVAIGLVILVFAVLSISDNLIQVEAKRSNVDMSKHDTGFFTGVSRILGKKAPKYVKDAGFYHFSKGFDLKLAGEAEDKTPQQIHTPRYALKPTDFIGISPIPKVTVEVGSEVKAGDPIFFDKKRPEIMYCAPVSGEVIEVKRGAKRSISEVIILADKEVAYKKFNPPALEAVDRDELKNFLAESGVWAMINQRPFDIVAELDVTPKNIFVSTFDSAPLAVDYNVVVEGQQEDFQKGLDVLGKLTDGSVCIGLDARTKKAPSEVFRNAEGVKKNYFSGKHPSGNVGVQIHHVAPIKGNDKVWTMGVQEVIILGRLFNKGIFDTRKVVAVGGGILKEPKYVSTHQGAEVTELIGQVDAEQYRVISGDVFSGKQIEPNGFLGFKEDQITVLKEGDYYEPFGWLLPLSPRPSASNTYPNFLFPDFKFEGDTNTHGEKRAFVVSGSYEAVLPMDIYPMHLMKAIMANDFERMEGLGINELSEEDVAVCEFVCTSKMPLQSILRQGLDIMREQG